MNTPINIYAIARALQASHGVALNVPAAAPEGIVRLRVPLGDNGFGETQKAVIVAPGGQIAIPQGDLTKVAPTPVAIAERLAQGHYLKAGVVPGSAAGKYTSDEIRLRAKNLIHELGDHNVKNGQLGLVSHLLNTAGIPHKVIAPNVEGGWKGDIDPHIAVDVSEDDKDRAAKLLGYAFKQDAIGSESSARDGANALRFRIEPPVGGLTKKHFDAIRKNLPADDEVDDNHYPTPEMRDGAKHGDVVMFNVDSNTPHHRIARVAQGVAHAMQSAGLYVSPQSLTLHGARTDYHDTLNPERPSDPRVDEIATAIHAIHARHFDK